MNNEAVASRPRRQEPRRRRKLKRYRRPGNGELLTKEELGRALGESTRTITNWTQKHLLPVIVLGHRTRRYRLADVFEKLGRRMVKGGAR